MAEATTVAEPPPAPEPPRGGLRLPSWVTELGRPGARRLLAWQALIDSSGNGIALGLLTLYLIGPAGLTTSEVAACLSAAAVAGLLATLPARRLMPRIGARRYAIISSLVRGALIAVLPFTSGVVPVFVLMVLNGAAEAGRYAMYQVIIVDVVPEKDRGEVLGIRRAIGNLGFTVAAGLATLAIAGGSRGAFQVAFLFDAFTFVAAALMVARIKTSPPSAAEPGTRPRGFFQDRRYLTLTALRSVCGVLATSVFTVGLPLWVTTKTDAPAWLAGILLGLNTLLVVLFQVGISARVVGLVSARRFLLLGSALTSAGMVGFAVASHVGAVTAAILLLVGTVLAVFGEMTDTASWWVISIDLAPADRRAEYLTTFDISTPATEIIGPTSMVLVVALGSTGWLAFGALVLIACVWSALLLPRETPTGKDSAPS
ncbi:MFS transporter [Streptomyces sp. NBC_00335]|uniref:MFS transporter n=1 Tax=unclassified Streptomyces TaxID=2593676 RepID=UPI00225C1783|nr:MULTISPECIES: MFS transporter [unclassified Streptomyces]MCX5408779.1 MFS transporter [Streptomyces sp. NBC_00086]